MQVYKSLTKYEEIVLKNLDTANASAEKEKRLSNIRKSLKTFDVS